MTVRCSPGWSGMMFLFPMLCVLIGSTEGVIGKDNPPQWSPVYTVKGLLYLPRSEIQEPLHTWYDSKAKKSRTDYYNGTMKTYQISLKNNFGFLARIIPVTTEEYLNRETCFKAEETVNILQSVLPDMTDFKFNGSEILYDIDTEKWQLEKTVDHNIVKYTMWIKHDNSLKKEGNFLPIPVRYEKKAYNHLLGFQFDHYYIDYSGYDVKDIDPQVFVLDPSIKCNFLTEDINPATFNPLMEYIHPTKENHVHNEFETFKSKHSKTYTSEVEHEKRFNLFRHNLRYINSHNRAGHSFTMAVNQFTDKTDEEMKRLNKRTSSGPIMGLPFPYSESQIQKEAEKLPIDHDWRLYGAVTPVKYQAGCGSCWAFSATGAVEGALFLKNGGTLQRLSEQALIDCSWGYDNHGCDGGLATSAFEWIILHGLPTEEEYGGYLGMEGSCLIQNVTIATKIKNYVHVTSNNENALKLAIYKHGPISVSIDANHKNFFFYSSGVYYEPQCRSEDLELDHAVLAVGYGTLRGEKYWLIKNSWAYTWGDDGYILMSMRNNNCGVQTGPTYVLI